MEQQGSSRGVKGRGDARGWEGAAVGGVAAVGGRCMVYSNPTRSLNTSSVGRRRMRERRVANLATSWCWGKGKRRLNTLAVFGQALSREDSLNMILC